MTVVDIAGDMRSAKMFLAQVAAHDGNCWSVEPIEFIYSGGRELGMVIRYINYPRFPWGKTKIREKSIEIAKQLIEYLAQGSCTIVYTDETIFLTRREGD